MKDRTPIIASAIAAVAGIIVAVAVALVGSNVATHSKPTTTVSNPDNGFLKGSTQYGTRDNAGADS